MDHHAISQQLLLEHQNLANITNSLRATIDWRYEGADLSRKLASLSFVGQSFQRHLKHMMALEEVDGYMAVVVESHPEQTAAVDALRQEHVRFRKQVGRLVRRLRRVEPTDRVAVEQISQELLVVLDRLGEHTTKEIDLLQRTLLSDAGGEG